MYMYRGQHVEHRPVCNLHSLLLGISSCAKQMKCCICIIYILCNISMERSSRDLLEFIKADIYIIYIIVTVFYYT